MNGQTKTIQSVDRALDLLDEMVALSRPVRLKELSSRCGLNMTTCFHILNTIVRRGLVVVNPATKEYRLGLEMLKFSRAVLHDLEIGDRVRDHLSGLAEETGETANLVVFEGDMAVHVDQARSSRPSSHRVSEVVGSRIPLYCTGVGKVYLASLPEQEVRKVLERTGMPRLTPHTIVSMDEMSIELAAIRAGGYAINNQEREEGVRCLAAPLIAQSGRVIAAMSISGPVHRVNQDTIGSLAQILTRTVNELNTLLGGFFDSLSLGRGTTTPQGHMAGALTPSREEMQYIVQSGPSR